MATLTAVCSICKDSIIKLQNPEPRPQLHPSLQIPDNVNAVVALCGHTFHSYCIMRWMHSSSNPSCPNCRKAIAGRGNCIPIYFDTYDMSLDSSTAGSVDTDALQEENAALKRDIRKVQADMDRLNSTTTSLRQINQVLSLENSSLVQRLQTEEAKSDAYMMRYQEAASYKSYAEQKERECKKVKDELETLQYVKAIVEGVRFNPEEEFKTFPVTNESIKSLIQLKNVLQQEIENAKINHQKHNVQKEESRKEILKLRSEIRKLTTDNDDLKFQLQNTQRSRSVAPTSTFTSAAGSSESDDSPIITPRPNRLAMLDDSIEILGVFNGDDNDDDFGLITGLGTGLKRSRSKVEKTKLPPVPNKSVKRADSLVATRRGRGVHAAEPLSPLNVRYRAGVPGMPIDGLVHRSTKGSTKSSARPNWKL